MHPAYRQQVDGGAGGTLGGSGGGIGGVLREYLVELLVLLRGYLVLVARPDGHVAVHTLVVPGLSLFSLGLLRLFSFLFLLYLLFLLVNFGFALFGAGDGMGIYATPLGFLVAGIGALLAAGFLVLDFGTIEEGIEAKAPEHMEWRAAFGLMLTLVWLYIEMLRLIGMARR